MSQSEGMQATRTKFAEKNARRKIAKSDGPYSYGAGRRARRQFAVNGAFGKFKNDKDRKDVYSLCLKGTSVYE